MKMLIIVMLGGLVAGCSTKQQATPDIKPPTIPQAKPSADEARFYREVREFSSRDVSQWPKRLMVGFPAGENHPLSDSQARRLQSILSHAQYVPEEVYPPGMTVSPSHQLCVLKIADRTWYFMPPGNPVRFDLAPVEQRKFEEFMRREFSLR